MIFIYGATGTVGSSVSYKISKSHDVLLSGRNEEKLRSISENIYRETGRKIAYIPLDIKDIWKLNLKKSGVKLILNLSGLQGENVEKLILYAIENKINYLDICADARTAINVYLKYNGLSINNKVLVIQSAGFNSVVGETLVLELLLDDVNPRKINILYGSTFIMKPGNLKSFIYLISTPPVYTRPINIFWDGERWVEEPISYMNFEGGIYASLPTVDLSTIPRIINRKVEIRTFMRIPKFLKPFLKPLILANRPQIREKIRRLRDLIPNLRNWSDGEDRVDLRILVECEKGHVNKAFSINNPIVANNEIILCAVDEMLKNRNKLYGIIPPTVAFVRLKDIVHQYVKVDHPE